MLLLRRCFESGPAQTRRRLRDKLYCSNRRGRPRALWNNAVGENAIGRTRAARTVIRLSVAHSITQAIRKHFIQTPGARRIATLYDSRGIKQVADITCALCVCRYADQARRNPARLPGCLVVTVNEQPVLHNRAAYRAAKLVLSKGPARGIEEISGIKLVVAEKLKRRPMPGVCPRLGDHVDDCSGVLPIFCRSGVGDYFELLNGIQVGYEARAIVPALFNCAPVHHEPICSFASAIHCKVAGASEACGGSVLERACGCLWNDPSLQPKQIDIAAAVERKR